MSLTTMPSRPNAAREADSPYTDTLPTPGARPLSQRKKRRLWPLFLTGILLAAAGTGLYLFTRGSAATSNTILTYTAQPESFDVRIPLSGELKAMRNVEIRNSVEGQTTILTLIQEGSRVKEGDVLVTLASDAIQDKLEDARIRVENAIATRINAEETLKIQEMQNESDTKAAETNAKLAQMAFDQFDKGDGPVQLDTNKTALENAVTDLERKSKDRKEVEDLSKRGFVSENDVLDAKIAERDSQNKLDTAKSNLDVWNKYAEPKQRTTLARAREEALAEVERVKVKCSAALLLKKAAVRAGLQTEHVETSRLKVLQQQFEACTVKAPQPGMVVYQSSIQQGGQNQGLIEEGAQVRLNQILIQLPDTGRMLVEVRLAEQLIERVKRGQEAVVTVDALPGKLLHGRVEEIAVLPDSSNRWMNPNLKEYPTRIILDETPAGLKPGMSAKVEILVAHFNDVLAAPLQAVFYGGGKAYVFVGSPENYEKRFVTAGASSSTRIQILDGIKTGEILLLSKPKDAPDDPQPSDSQPGRGKKNRGAPAGAPVSPTTQSSPGGAKTS